MAKPTRTMRTIDAEILNVGIREGFAESEVKRLLEIRGAHLTETFHGPAGHVRGVIDCLGQTLAGQLVAFQFNDDGVPRTVYCEEINRADRV